MLLRSNLFTNHALNDHISDGPNTLQHNKPLYTSVCEADKHPLTCCCARFSSQTMIKSLTVQTPFSTTSLYMQVCVKLINTLRSNLFTNHELNDQISDCPNTLQHNKPLYTSVCEAENTLRSNLFTNHELNDHISDCPNTLQHNKPLYTSVCEAEELKTPCARFSSQTMCSMITSLTVQTTFSTTSLYIQVCVNLKS